MFEPKHTALLEQYADKFGLPYSSADEARKWTLHLAEQFKFTMVSEGWGTKKAGPLNPQSTDVICRFEGARLIGYDVVINAGAPTAVLNSHPEPMDISDQVYIIVNPVNHLASEPPSEHPTLLTKSLFWAWGGFKKYEAQLEKNIRDFKDDSGGDAVRWFFTLGNEGPWQDVGALYSDPNHMSIAHHVMELLQTYDLKSHLTLCGGLDDAGNCSEQYNTEAKRFAIVDRAAALINAFPDDFIVCEIVNEYIVNGWERAWVRACARRLRDQVPEGFPITLSSPNCVMGGHASAEEVLAEINAMYGGDSGANVLTIHPTRPYPVWCAEKLRHIGITMPIIEGESRGPGASGGGDVSDPRILASDYESAIRAKALSKDLHTAPGVWGGHCATDPEENMWNNFVDIPTWAEIASTLGAIRHGEDMAHVPHPYEQVKVSEVRYYLEKDYARAEQAIDGGIIDWSEQTMIDYYNGMIWEDSLKKHREEWCKRLGIPVIDYSE